MRKLVFILFLLVINIFLLYSKIVSASLRNVKLQLDSDEVGIVLLYLEGSTSLLIQRDDVSYIYVIDYTDDEELYENISLFTNNIEYVFMDKEYPLKYPYKVVVDGNIIIGGVHIQIDRINYNGHTLCINTTSDCDYVYLTREMEIEETSTLIYNSDLDEQFINGLKGRWIDLYEVSDDEYIILIFGTESEIIKLDR